MENKKYLVIPYLCVAGYVLTAHSQEANNATATSTPTTISANALDVVHVGLTKAMSKDKLAAFLRTNKIKPTAFFYWSHGRGGTVREYESIELLTHEEIIQKALAKIVSHKKTAKAGDILLARQFVKDYSLGRVLNNKDLEETARHRLYTMNQRLASIKSIENGLPVIYGMEVHVGSNKREKLYNRSETRALFSKNIALSYRKAKASKSNAQKLDRPKYFEPIRPREFSGRPSPKSDKSAHLSVEEVYKQLKAIAEMSIPADNKDE